MDQLSQAVAAPLERRVRPHPLEIRNCSGEDSNCLMSKGHQDLQAFKVAAQAWWGDPIDHWEPPRHVWWRVIPAPRGSDYKHYYDDAAPHSRGAFPATVMESY